MEALIFLIVTVASTLCTVLPFTLKSVILRPRDNRRVGFIGATKIDEITFEGSLVPITNNILVKVSDPPDETFGGIIIPEKSKVKPTEGEVIAVGDGALHKISGKLMTLSVQVGDRVLYGEYDGSALKYDGKNYQIIKDDDVLIKFLDDKRELATAQCVNDNVLLEILPKDIATGSGIILASSDSKEIRQDKARVIKIGPGKLTANGDRIPIDLKEGDFVKISTYGGNEVKIEGKSYLVVKSYIILAKWS